MKKIFAALVLIALSLTATFMACEKDVVTPSSEPLARRGGRNNTGGSTTPVVNNDSILNACGIVLADTGQSYPTVQLTNIRWRKQTGYSFDPATGGYTYPYDILTIEFDNAIIAGKTVSCYMLFADQCQGRVVCNKMNGLAVSQVTTCTNTNRITLPIGTSWLNPYVASYTGYIYIGTTDGCSALSQRFTFEPPRILAL